MAAQDKNIIDRRTSYYFVGNDGKPERQKSRRALERKIKARKRNAQELDSFDKPRGGIRAREYVDGDQAPHVRGWSAKKKVGLNPEDNLEIVEYLREERKMLLESWSEEEITDYYVENSEGEEIPIDEYED